jgi:transcription antitermination factor NusA-like protein
VQYVNGTVVEDLSPVPDVIQGQGSISLYLKKAFDHEKVQCIEYKVNDLLEK